MDMDETKKETTQKKEAMSAEEAAQLAAFAEAIEEEKKSPEVFDGMPVEENKAPAAADDEAAQLAAFAEAIEEEKKSKGASAGAPVEKAPAVAEDDEAAQLAAFAEAMEEEKKSKEIFAGVPVESKKGPATFDDVPEGGERRPPRDIEFLLDIPLLVSVEIGRTRMLIKDLLQLGQGSVIEFDKLVGEPMEVLVNDKLIARGEVVVVNEKFGVRLTDISSPAERLKHLNK